MMRRRNLLAAALLTFAAAANASCQDSTEGASMTPVTDLDLNAKIAALRESGESAPLATLTKFQWEEVYCYYEGTPADEINKEVGSTVFAPGGYPMISGALAIFVNDGKVARSLVIPELVFDKGKQPAGVIVEQGFKLVAPK